jgi:hypothetical protein
MTRQGRYPQEPRERAIRMVFAPTSRPTGTGSGSSRSVGCCRSPQGRWGPGGGTPSRRSGGPWRHAGRDALPGPRRDPPEHHVADSVVVPRARASRCCGDQAGVTGVLGQRPAVLAWQVRQQPQHQRPGPPAWLHPTKPARDPAQQRIQFPLPAGRDDAVACSDRLIFGCSHTTASSTVAALLCSPGRPRAAR